MTSGGTIEVWVTLQEVTPLANVLGVLAADPRFDAQERPWPSEGMRKGPEVLVVSIDAPESVSAVRGRLGGPGGLRAVVVISSELSIDAARRSVVAGADAVLLADDVGSLPAAILAACSKLLVLSPALSNAIARPSLTTREKQILAMLVMGMSNQEIAARLFVAESTVKSHLFSAYRRLGVRTRREAVAVITDPDRGFGSGILGLTGLEGGSLSR